MLDVYTGFVSLQVCGSLSAVSFPVCDIVGSQNSVVYLIEVASHPEGLVRILWKILSSVYMHYVMAAYAVRFMFLYMTTERSFCP